MADKHPLQSCATCGEISCSNSYARQHKKDSGKVTAYLLDDAWPEYKAYVSQHMKSGDQLLAPGIAGRKAIRRYDWDLSVVHTASVATLLRHATMYLVKNRRGAERQKSYLYQDSRIAKALCRHLDYHASHLVISQNYLPWLLSSNLLGGRTYDVLMTRYPFLSVHQKLDALAALYPNSATVTDFRVSDELVEMEWKALHEAKHIVTPHYGIASLFSQNAQLLDWNYPSVIAGRSGERVAFLGPTIARQGAHWAKEIAQYLTQPLIVFGNDLEGVEFWSGVTIERRRMADKEWSDVGIIIHPAAMTNQPRILLEAHARGIQIYTTPESGLAPHQYQPLENFLSATWN